MHTIASCRVQLPLIVACVYTLSSTISYMYMYMHTHMCTIRSLTSCLFTVYFTCIRTWHPTYLCGCYMYMHMHWMLPFIAYKCMCTHNWASRSELHLVIRVLDRVTLTVMRMRALWANVNPAYYKFKGRKFFQYSDACLLILANDHNGDGTTFSRLTNIVKWWCAYVMLISLPYA